MASTQDPAHSRGARLIEFLGLRRSIVGLLSMVVLVGMGEHMAERFLPLYLQRARAARPASSPSGSWRFSTISSRRLYSFPGGYLTDRLGHKRALLVFNLISMAGYLIVIFDPHVVGGVGRRGACSSRGRRFRCRRRWS